MVKMSKKILKQMPMFALGITLVFTSVGNGAYAQQAVAVVADPQAAANTASILSQLQTGTLATIGSIASNITNTISAITTFMNGTIDSLRLHSGQQTANFKRNITAMGRIADTQDARAVLREQQKAKLDAINTATSAASTCNVITGNIGGQNIQNAVQIWREQVTEATLNLQAGASDSPSGAGAGAGSEAILGAHCKYNATDLDVQQGICSAAVPNPTSLNTAAGMGSPLVGADLNAGTILNSLNGVLSDSDQRSARNYMAQAIVGLPLGRLSKADAQTPEGRARVKARNTYLARNSAAASVVGDIYASEVPFQTDVADGNASNPNGVSIQSWAEATAQQVLGYDRSGSNANFPNGVSKNAWLELRARAWFMNPNWAIKMDSQRVDQTAKDLALMTSFMVYQNNEMYRKAEQTNFLLAHILAILNEQNRDRL